MAALAIRLVSRFGIHVIILNLRNSTLLLQENRKAEDDILEIKTRSPFSRPRSKLLLVYVSGRCSVVSLLSEPFSTTEPFDIFRFQ